VIVELHDGHLDRPCPSCGRTAGRILCPVLDLPRGAPPAGYDDLVACGSCGWIGHLACPLVEA
jgi:hypothetical protein